MPRVPRTVTLGMMGHSGSRIPAGGGGLCCSGAAYQPHYQEEKYWEPCN